MFENRSTHCGINRHSLDAALAKLIERRNESRRLLGLPLYSISERRSASNCRRQARRFNRSSGGAVAVLS